MSDQSPVGNVEIGNTEGNNNTTIIAIIPDNLTPSGINPDNLVASIKDRLNSLEKKPRYEWIPITVMLAFGAYCVLLLASPLLLTLKGVAIADIQSITLVVASAMSGITGLLGVILGGRIKLFGK
jgi:hypothetical protein